jgi:hypothetical protein
MKTLTHDEQLSIIEASLAASEEGRDEVSLKLMQDNFPLAPHLAKVAKEYFGKEYLLASGWDLSEAEVAYGSDWLSR